MLEPDEGAGDEATSQIAVAPDAPHPPPAEAVAGLCRRIAARLPKQTIEGDVADELRQRLAGFSIPFASPDQSGRWNYGWPGSRLTGDDVRKLNVLSNSAGMPCTELIHVAVGLLYEQTRDVVQQLLMVQDQAGLPFRDLAEQMLGTPADPAERPAELYGTAARTVPINRHPHRQSASVQRGMQHHADPDGEVAATSVLAAEAPAVSVPAGTSFFPLAPMAPRPTSKTDPETPNEQLALLMEEVHTLRDEVRVLREAIDEFREAIEHSVRNLPDRLPPPLRIWSLPADPTAPDFGERINAVPTDVLERLRGETVAGSISDSLRNTAESPPPRSDASDQTAVLPRRRAASETQGRLF